MLERSISERFMTESHRSMWEFVNEPEEVIPTLLKMEETLSLQ